MSIIWIEFLTLIHKTNLVLEDRKATIDVEVLSLLMTDFSELIRSIEWKTVCEDS